MPPLGGQRGAPSAFLCAPYRKVNWELEECGSPGKGIGSGTGEWGTLQRSTRRGARGPGTAQREQDPQTPGRVHA